MYKRQANISLRKIVKYVLTDKSIQQSKQSLQLDLCFIYSFINLNCRITLST